MAKKIEPIEGTGRNPERWIVQKSKPLAALAQSELTLSEFKILDTYLSRINSRTPEKRVVRFEKGELEKLLGVTKINLAELKDRLKHLMGNVVEVPDEKAKKGFRVITLFEEAVAEQDEDGLWQINLECTHKAMQYIFNIEELGYLRYKLRCITSISSRYSYILFCYIEKNKYKKSWEISFEELKELLSCENEPTYQQFYRFNDLLLKRCHKELNGKTECKFTYEPIKKGRCVTAVRFTVKTSDKLPAEKEIELPLLSGKNFVEDEREKNYSAEWLPYARATEFELSEKELISLNDYIPSLITKEDERVRYLRNYYHDMDARAKQKDHASRKSYLKKMLESNLQKETDKRKRAEEHKPSYDLDAFEKSSINWQLFEESAISCPPEEETKK